MPTLRQLTVPTLAMWGELDNNIMADKNKPAWDTALKAAGNRDYTLVVIPRANHAMLEAKSGATRRSSRSNDSRHRISRRSRAGSRNTCGALPLTPSLAVLTSKRQSLDTAGSALTGRHPPAAREHSHLFGLSRVRVHLLSAWFQRGTGDS